MYLSNNVIKGYLQWSDFKPMDIPWPDHEIIEVLLSNNSLFISIYNQPHILIVCCLEVLSVWINIDVYRKNDWIGIEDSKHYIHNDNQVLELYSADRDLLIKCESKILKHYFPPGEFNKYPDRSSTI